MTAETRGRDTSDNRRVAGWVKVMAYALAAGGLFAWFILDRPLIGVILLVTAAADGFAAVIMNRRSGKQNSGIEEGH